MKLAIIILNWRNAKKTINCAQKILGSQKYISKIYIIDNNSCDGSIELFKEHLSNCKILQNSTNSGYTGGNNFGLFTAFSDGNDLALILNNDIEPHLNQEFTLQVSRIFEKKPNTLIGVPVEDVDGRSIYPHVPSVFFKSLFSACGINEVTPIICGCSMIISRKSFELIGGLNEKYFMYCEELDYSIRVAATGGSIVCPTELGYVVRDDKEERRPYVYYYQTRNLLHLINQHARKGKVFLLTASILIAFKQAIISGKGINIYLTFRGVIDAIKKKIGYNPIAHN